MTISRINFPIYGIIILTSIITGMIYIFFKLKENNNTSKEIFYYFIIYLTFAFLGGKMYTILVYYQVNLNLFTAGLSAYGGLIGVVIGSIIFEKMFYCKKEIIKYTVLSLPLVYGLTKIACFISGCCNGIPYNGIFSVVYKDGLNIKQKIKKHKGYDPSQNPYKPDTNKKIEDPYRYLGVRREEK